MKCTLLDGAFGSILWERSGMRIPVWKHNWLHPELVRQLTQEYIESGSEIVQANSFSLTWVSSLSELEDIEEEVALAVTLAREVVSECNPSVKVGLSLGPIFSNDSTIKAWTREEQNAFYLRLMSAGVEAGADVIQLETFMNVNMLAVAVEAASQFDVPVFASMTFGKDGKTPCGNSVDDILLALKSYRVDAVGLNCSFGPDYALPVIKEFASKTSLPLYYKPNNMNPDGLKKTFSASEFAWKLQEAEKYVSYVGGCCGTDCMFVKELREKFS